MLNQKEKVILHYLVENKHHYRTSKDIATYLSCSNRTARTYLKNLIDQIEGMNAIDIVSKQGYGYKMEILDKEAFYSFLKQNQLIEQSPFSGELGIENRQKYIINKLLFEQVAVYFEDLMDELFVSRSTLSTDFRKIRKTLEDYDLGIESKANHGVYIIGKERDKRRFIMDYFFRAHFFQTMTFCTGAGELFSENVPVELITLIVIEECREAGLKLSDFVIQNLVVHIALVCQRLRKECNISSFEDPIMKKCEKERQVAKNILQRLSSEIGLNFPETEIDYITLHLISKSYHQNDALDDRRTTDVIRLQLLDVLKNHLLCDYPFYEDFQLLEGVTTHLLTLLIRLENRVVLDNPLLEEIQTQYSSVFMMTRNLFQFLPLFEQKEISDGEIAYVALHFLASIERFKEKNKLNVLVICATGYGSAQMLKNRIENEFGQSLNIVDVCGYYDLDGQSFSGIDFIVSSIDLSNLVFRIPVFTVSIFLNSDEVRYIKREIKKISKGKLGHSTLLGKGEYKKSRNDLERSFDDYFSEDKFYVVSSSHDKQEVLEILLDKMKEDDEPDYVSKMLRLIEQREMMSTIMFTDNMAVPHPLHPLSKYHSIGVILAPDGIRWSDNQKKVQIVFLVSPSIYENERLPLLTSRIVSLVDQDERRDALAKCQNFREFKQVFLTKEEENI